MPRVLIVAAVVAFVISACGRPSATEVATEGPAVTGPVAPDAATTLSPDLGANTGGAVEPTTDTTTTTSTTVPSTTTSAPDRFEPVGERVAAPAVVAICDRVAILTISVASMGPDYSPDEAATLSSSLESLSMDSIDAAMDPLVQGDGFSASRLAECLETAAFAVGSALGVEL